MSLPAEWALPTAANAPKARVLVVDDETRLLRAYSRLLGSTGYEVLTASDGTEAVRVFREQRAEIVITDLAMPGMSGLQLMRQLREVDPDVPVILITAAPTTETAVRAVEYGALRYLLKPVSSDALERALADALAQRWSAVRKQQAEVLFADFNRRRGDQVHLDKALTNAIRTIQMHFQPIVSWMGQSLKGYEALVRAGEPSLPHPGALFDAAERLSRIEDLGRAIRDAIARGIDGAPPGHTFFVNLHPRELNDEQLFSPQAPLSRHAKNVVLEVTERMALRDVDDLHARVSALRQMGYRIAIDDIGAGYAGLTSFALLEPDVVKLDMALVRDVHRTPTKKKLVQSMVTLCADLNIQMIAEGVETPDERDALVEMGCDLLQGYLFGRPSPMFAPARW